jgi:pimeloyl-ACP methyl ester carboxylesterase
MKEKNHKRESYVMHAIGFVLKIAMIVFPGTVKKLIIKKWETPQHFPMPEIELHASKSAVPDYVTFDDIKIRIWSWGSGPSVVFLHGWAGRGTQVYAYINQLNNAGFRVVGIDLPGHGQSTGKSVNYTHMTKVVASVLQNTDNLHSIITHSFGGLLFAAVYNNLLPLKKIVFICPPASFETPLNFLRNTLPFSAKINEEITHTVRGSYTNDQFERLSTVKNVARITQPVLILHDKDDHIVPFSDGEEVAKAAKNCVFRVSNGLGHRKILHDKDTVNDIVRFIVEDE